MIATSKNTNRTIEEAFTGLASPTLHPRYNLLPRSMDSLRAPLFSHIYQKHQSATQMNQYPDVPPQVRHLPKF